MATTLVTSYEPAVNDGLVIDSASNCPIDDTNGNHFTWSQFTALFIHNSSATDALTATISSNTDDAGKSKTITAVIPADDYAVVNLLDTDFATAGSVSIAWSGTTPSGFVFPLVLTKP